MDVAYPLDVTKTSKSLVYSLRTVDKHLDVDDIYIVGRRPAHLAVREIRELDTKMIPMQNALDKLEAVLDSEISEDFIWMNDDFFLFQDYDIIPYYHKGKIEEQPKTDYWQEKLPNLLKHFPEGKFFEVHFPIVFSKDKLAELIDYFGKEEIARGAYRSYYCNYFDIEGEYTEDYKAESVDELRNDTPFLSTVDEIEDTREFRSLFKHYPKSNYEIGERVWDIYE